MGCTCYSMVYHFFYNGMHPSLGVQTGYGLGARGPATASSSYQKEHINLLIHD